MLFAIEFTLLLFTMLSTTSVRKRNQIDFSHFFLYFSERVVYVPVSQPVYNQGGYVIREPVGRY